MKKPSKCISIKQAKELQDEWWKTRSEVTTNGKKHEDSCKIHYTLDELQEYLDYVRDKSTEQNIKDPGINIWFGAYPKEDGKPSLATVFLAASKKKKFESCDEDDDDQGNDDNYEDNDEIDPFNDGSVGWPPSKY
ncbi:hypothetical protein L1I30_12965 [Gillisia sp. M10.2A]|uniref:Uncharacterized protein n=1 Tax=Gillisia lutea TaxID=2909668 RepID=A0ABS9EI93_9FLAO|nr:hypothetical protein [Gillisia lutea]MCF4102580.1 hypothetical protein [Gillisia lutea]